jgi:hypothetical protein
MGHRARNNAILNGDISNGADSILRADDVSAF